MLKRKITIISVIAALLSVSLIHAKLVEVEVRSGDTLHGFALKYLKDPSRWPKIHELNKKIINDPNKIFPGQVIKVPVKMLKDKVGDITSLKNSVKIKKRERGDWQKGTMGERMFPEDGVLTGKKSFARVDFLVGSNLKIYENSLIYIKPTKKKTAVASLLKGGLNVEEAKIITPSAEIIPKAKSKYDVDVDKDKSTKVSVRGGEVDVSAQGKIVTVMKGFRTMVEFKSAPQFPVALPLGGEEALEFKDDITANKDLTFYLQVSRTQDFKITVKDQETSDMSLEYIRKDLKPAKYYWRVAIIDNHGFKGDFSEPRTFVVGSISHALVELTGFEVVNHEERIMKVSGFARNAQRVVVNGYPARLNERGEFKTTIVLTEDQKTITVTASGSEGVVLRKYYRTDDGMWLPVK